MTTCAIGQPSRYSIETDDFDSSSECTLYDYDEVDRGLKHAQSAPSLFACNPERQNPQTEKDVSVTLLARFAEICYGKANGPDTGSVKSNLSETTILCGKCIGQLTNNLDGNFSSVWAQIAPPVECHVVETCALCKNDFVQSEQNNQEVNVLSSAKMETSRPINSNIEVRTGAAFEGCVPSVIRTDQNIVKGVYTSPRVPRVLPPCAVPRTLGPGGPGGPGGPRGLGDHEYSPDHEGRQSRCLVSRQCVLVVVLLITFVIIVVGLAVLSVLFAP